MTQSTSQKNGNESFLDFLKRRERERLLLSLYFHSGNESYGKMLEFAYQFTSQREKFRNSKEMGLFYKALRSVPVCFRFSFFKILDLCHLDLKKGFSIFEWLLERNEAETEAYFILVESYFNALKFLIQEEGDLNFLADLLQEEVFLAGTYDLDHGLEDVEADCKKKSAQKVVSKANALETLKACYLRSDSCTSLFKKEDPKEGEEQMNGKSYFGIHKWERAMQILHTILGDNIEIENPSFMFDGFLIFKKCYPWSNLSKFRHAREFLIDHDYFTQLSRLRKSSQLSLSFEETTWKKKSIFLKKFFQDCRPVYDWIPFDFEPRIKHLNYRRFWKKLFSQHCSQETLPKEIRSGVQISLVLSLSTKLPSLTYKKDEPISPKECQMKSQGEGKERKFTQYFEEEQKKSSSPTDDQNQNVTDIKHSANEELIKTVHELIEECHALNTKGEGSSEIDEILGDCYYELEDWEEAKNYFEKVRTVEGSRNERAQFYYSCCLFNLKLYKQAIPEFLQLIGSNLDEMKKCDIFDYLNDCYLEIEEYLKAGLCSRVLDRLKSSEGELTSGEESEVKSLLCDD